MKKYLVVRGFEVETKLYTKEEIYKEFFGTYVNLGGWHRVENEEEAYELLMEERIDDYVVKMEFLEDFLEDYGKEDPLKKWKNEVKHKIYKGMRPNLELYEIGENQLKRVSNDYDL